MDEHARSMTACRSLRAGAMMCLLLASAAWAQTRPCLANFTEDGSLFKGKIYKSHAEYPGKEQSEVFDRVLQAVAGGGWQILTVSKEVGMISATSSSIGKSSAGRSTPLSVFVKRGPPVRTEVIFSTPPGVFGTSDSIRDALCKVLD